MVQNTSQPNIKVYNEYNLEAEYEDIKHTFEELLDLRPTFRQPENEQLIRKAFSVAYEGHKDMRRKSGEPYIYHPIAVARIVAEEIGLGTTSVVAALLHDVVEDTDFTLENIANLFGEKIALIVGGLTKIQGTVENVDTVQSETLKKVVLSLSEDLRVVMVKLADRLHNLRTLGSMPDHKKLRSIAETQFLYAPLAHRLGLYVIKTELENLCFFHTNREDYRKVAAEARRTAEDNQAYLNNFSEAISKELENTGIHFKIVSRTKSIYSIWKKMQKQGIEFDEVFDLLALRVIFDLGEEIDPEEERRQCWQIFSLISAKYKPKPDRMRDWVSNSKANGYEALHATFMTRNGKWIEVQIRSRRMHDIAEKGIAAHWKYKNQHQTGHNAAEFDKWINDIKDFLAEPDESTQEFLDVFKLNLFSEEIYSYTPKGKMISLPKGATVLDFAYEIHSEIGNKCLAAKVNKELVSRDTVLQNGDLVEVLTSEKAKPLIEWLDIVKSAKAKSAINYALKDYKKIKIQEGRRKFERFVKEGDEKLNDSNINKVLNVLGYTHEKELYLKLSEDQHSKAEVLKAIRRKRAKKIVSIWSFRKKDTKKKNIDLDKEKAFDYQTFECCNPIPGDEVMGFMEEENILIHQVGCQVAIDRMSRDAKSIVKVSWNKKTKLAVLATINIEGTDARGLFLKISEVISKAFKVSIRSINFDVKDGLFKGTIDVYVQDINHVNNMISKLVNIKGIEKVNRVFDNSKKS